MVWQKVVKITSKRNDEILVRSRSGKEYFAQCEGFNVEEIEEALKKDEEVWVNIDFVRVPKKHRWLKAGTYVFARDYKIGGWSK